jgi:hypothetical protein
MKVSLNTYKQKRAAHYPTVEDQLDMLWHAMDTGKLEKAEPFYSTLKAVKDTVPKT